MPMPSESDTTTRGGDVQQARPRVNARGEGGRQEAGARYWGVAWVRLRGAAQRGAKGARYWGVAWVRLRGAAQRGAKGTGAKGT